jgi:hypothetical protein
MTTKPDGPTTALPGRPPIVDLATRPGATPPDTLGRDWGPTSRPVPQWTRPGATPADTLGRDGQHH